MRLALWPCTLLFRGPSRFVRYPSLDSGIVTCYWKLESLPGRCIDTRWPNQIRSVSVFRVPGMYAKSSRPYIRRPWPIGKDPRQSIYAINLSLFSLSFVSFFIVLLCHTLAALGFGSIFTVLRWKAVVSLPRKRGILCCFARKASVRRHESTAIILVLRGSFACKHNWRLRWGRSIGRSPARSCYVESIIDRLQSTTVIWILNLFM
jgi:hypothetical protein